MIVSGPMYRLFVNRFYDNLLLFLDYELHFVPSELIQKPLFDVANGLGQPCARRAAPLRRAGSPRHVIFGEN